MLPKLDQTACTMIVKLYRTFHNPESYNLAGEIADYLDSIHDPHAGFFRSVRIPVSSDLHENYNQIRQTLVEPQEQCRARAVSWGSTSWTPPHALSTQSDYVIIPRKHIPKNKWLYKGDIYTFSRTADLVTKNDKQLNWDKLHKHVPSDVIRYLGILTLINEITNYWRMFEHKMESHVDSCIRAFQESGLRSKLCENALEMDGDEFDELIKKLSNL